MTVIGWLRYRRRFAALLARHLDGGYRLSPARYEALKAEARAGGRRRDG